MKRNPMLALVRNPGQIVQRFATKREALAAGKQLAARGCKVNGRPVDGVWEIRANPKFPSKFYDSKGGPRLGYGGKSKRPCVSYEPASEPWTEGTVCYHCGWTRHAHKRRGSKNPSSAPRYESAQHEHYVKVLYEADKAKGGVVSPLTQVRSIGGVSMPGWTVWFPQSRKSVHRAIDASGYDNGRMMTNPGAEYHKRRRTEEKVARDANLHAADVARREGAMAAASEYEHSAALHDAVATSEFEDLMETSRLGLASKLGLADAAQDVGMRANPISYSPSAPAPRYRVVWWQGPAGTTVDRWFGTFVEAKDFATTGGAYNYTIYDEQGRVLFDADKTRYLAETKRLARGNPVTQKAWAKEVLSNDEASTDAELVALFISEGMTDTEARGWVAQRAKYLSGVIEHSDGSEESFGSYMKRRNPRVSGAPEIESIEVPLGSPQLQSLLAAGYRQVGTSGRYAIMKKNPYEVYGWKYPTAHREVKFYKTEASADRYADTLVRAGYPRPGIYKISERVYRVETARRRSNPARVYALRGPATLDWSGDIRDLPVVTRSESVETIHDRARLLGYRWKSDQSVFGGYWVDPSTSDGYFIDLVAGPAKLARNPGPVWHHKAALERREMMEHLKSQLADARSKGDADRIRRYENYVSEYEGRVAEHEQSMMAGGHEGAEEFMGYCDSIPAMARNPGRAYQVEILKASQYYGRHATGWVLLVNGHVYLHGDKMDCERVAARFTKNPGAAWHERELAKYRKLSEVSDEMGDDEMAEHYHAKGLAHKQSATASRRQHLANPGPRTFIASYKTLDNRDLGQYRFRASNDDDAALKAMKEGRSRGAWGCWLQMENSTTYGRHFVLKNPGVDPVAANPRGTPNRYKVEWFDGTASYTQSRTFPAKAEAQQFLEHLSFRSRQDPFFSADIIDVRRDRYVRSRNPGVDPVSGAYMAGLSRRGTPVPGSMRGRSKCPSCGDPVDGKGVCFRCEHPEIKKRPNPGLSASRQAAIAKTKRAGRREFYEDMARIDRGLDKISERRAKALKKFGGVWPSQHRVNPGLSADEQAAIGKIKGVEQWMLGEPKFIEALKKYIEFHGCWPTSISKRDIKGMGTPDQKEFLVNMGKALDVSYKPTAAQKGSNKYGSSWLHEFNENGNPNDEKALPDRPCTGDGKTIITHGGNYVVKDWVRK